MRNDRSFPWLPVLGALFGLFLIWQVRTQVAQAPEGLSATFAQQAAVQATESALAQTAASLTPRPQISLDDVRRLIPSTVPLPLSPFEAEVEPLASGNTARTRVDVLELAPMPDGSPGVLVKGVVTNTSQEEITIPISAFLLRDSTAAEYQPDGSATATLQPQESTTLELTVPVPDGRGLVLIVQYANEAPIELTLREASLSPL